jgi:hypothetical protein
MRVGHPHAAEEIALDIGETTQRWMERNEERNKRGGGIGGGGGGGATTDGGP